MLFKDVQNHRDGKKLSQIKRPNRNKREHQTGLSEVDILDLMGVNNRGHKRRRGAWRQA